MLALVTGGARSGKSTFAEKYAMQLGESGIYIATSQVYDDEMQIRVNRHQLRREQSGFQWSTIEEPLDLASVLKRLSGGRDLHKGAVVLIDCLTLWLSNWILFAENENTEKRVMDKINELTEVITLTQYPIILVTNEVGDGIVPEYPLGRLFRDLSGWMNQRVADVSDQVFLVTAGIPVELKSLAFHLRGE